MFALQPFGDKPVIVKDYVKSRKHEWLEACYIPSAADRDAVARIVHRFFELQGDDLNEGLVFREFIPLEPLGTHPKSGMPLAREYRRFYLDGVPLATSAYWDVADASDSAPPTDLFADVARGVPSRFFTLDFARAKSGKWLIIEPGDGQVAGLPERMNIQEFYRTLVAWVGLG